MNKIDSMVVIQLHTATLISSTAMNRLASHICSVYELYYLRSKFIFSIQLTSLSLFHLHRMT